MGPSEDDIGLAKVFVRRANADLDSAIILLEHGNMPIQFIILSNLQKRWLSRY